MSIKHYASDLTNEHVGPAEVIPLWDTLLNHCDKISVPFLLLLLGVQYLSIGLMWENDIFRIASYQSYETLLCHNKLDSGTV